MKYLLSITVTLLSIVLVSCSSELDEWNAAAKISGSVWGATESHCSVTREKRNGTDEQDIVKLTMQNLSLVPDDYPADGIASVAAVALIQNVRPELASSVEFLDINFDRGHGQESMSYAVPDINEANQLVTVVSDFLGAPYTNGLNEMKQYVDGVLVTDSVLGALSGALIQADSLYGKTTSHKIGGFKFDKLTGSNEPVLIVWASSEKATGQIPYTFYVSRQTKKIVSLSTVQGF